MSAISYGPSMIAFNDVISYGPSMIAFNDVTLDFSYNMTSYFVNIHLSIVHVFNGLLMFLRCHRPLNNRLIISQLE